MRRIVFCGLSDYHFSKFPQKWHDLQKNVTEHKICLNFLYDFCLKRFLIYDDICLYVKYPLFLSDLNQSRIFEKSSHNKFNENPSSRSQVVAWQKLAATFWNSADAPSPCHAPAVQLHSCLTSALWVLFHHPAALPSVTEWVTHWAL